MFHSCKPTRVRKRRAEREASSKTGRKKTKHQALPSERVQHHHHSVPVMLIVARETSSLSLHSPRSRIYQHRQTHTHTHTHTQQNTHSKEHTHTHTHTHTLSLSLSAKYVLHGWFLVDQTEVYPNRPSPQSASECKARNHSVQQRYAAKRTFRFSGTQRKISGVCNYITPDSLVECDPYPLASSTAYSPTGKHCILPPVCNNRMSEAEGMMGACRLVLVWRALCRFFACLSVCGS
jgi:hypothetical protein